MYRTRGLTVALCVALIAAVCRGQGILDGPDNDAVYANTEVALSCSATPGDRVQWIEYITSANGGIISDGDTLVPGHPNFARYRLDANIDAGTYVLYITDTQLIDGGLYECFDENTRTKLRAEIVVIAAAPNCTSTLPPNNIGVEGVRYTIECNIYFGASSGIYPSLTWTGPGNFNQLSAEQPGTVRSGVAFDAQKIQDGGRFTLTSQFTERGFGGEDTASNVPTFTNTYNSPFFFVQYGPQNVSYSPVKSSYEIGDEITCNSDSNPLATTVWTDMIRQIDYVRQTLVILDTMVGPAIFRCQVTNSISSANLFVNTTVNPITTPTTPTTTPTTTPVPAVSNCLDLTGRWEYQRSIDSKAVLCMYVNGRQNGYITGLFWNDTKTETYYMDIVGRTRNNIYDETGLVGIWPLNIGVTAFALECHRCLGEETLLLNAVSRTGQDDEFCGDGGNILTGVQYPLKRVEWSYPCFPLTTTKELRAISHAAAERRQKRLAAQGRRA